MTCRRQDRLVRLTPIELEMIMTTTAATAASPTVNQNARQPNPVAVGDGYCVEDLAPTYYLAGRAADGASHRTVFCPGRGDPDRHHAALRSQAQVPIGGPVDGILGRQQVVDVTWRLQRPPRPLTVRLGLISS